MSALTACTVRRLLAALTVALCAIGVLAGCSSGDDAVAANNDFQFVSPGGKTIITYDPPESRKEIGKVAGPALLGDGQINLEDYRGKVVVVNVWASWCPPCRKEFADLATVFKNTEAKGVQFIGIDFRDNKSDAQDFVQNRNVPYPSIYDYGGQTLATLRVPVGAVPTTVVLDRQLRPAVVFLKAVSQDELTQAVLRVAAEPGPKQ